MINVGFVGEIIGLQKVLYDKPPVPLTFTSLPKGFVMCQNLRPVDTMLVLYINAIIGIGDIYN